MFCYFDVLGHLFCMHKCNYNCKTILDTSLQHANIVCILEVGKDGVKKSAEGI